MITLIGLLLSIKSTENHQRAKGQVMGTPAHNENTKCLVFNTLTVWLKYQFNNTFEQEISVMLLTIFIETIMHHVYPPKFCMNMPSICLVTTVIPRRKWKQGLCIFFVEVGVGGGGGGINKVRWGLGENGEESLFHVTSLPPC